MESAYKVEFELEQANTQMASAEKSNSKNNKPARQEALQYGLDLSLMDSNLQKSPLERIRIHDHALTEALKIQAARKKTRAQV